jgi:integrase/recombinase XerD
MSRFTFNFYNDIRKPLKSGLYSIKVNLRDNHTKENINFTIKRVEGIEVSCSKSDWQDIWVNKDKKNSFGDVIGETTVYGHKMTIRTMLKAKEDILNDIVSTEGIRSASAIKDAFNDYRLPTSFNDDVYKEFQRRIDELNVSGQFKTKLTYETALNNIRKHNCGRPFRFSDVNLFWLQGYERARKKEGVSIASIGFDTKNLRAIYNRVAKKDAYLKENYPFGKEKNEYTIKTKASKNVGLRKPDLKKILDFSSENVYLQKARDIFIFSYYLGGFNWKDLILLTYKDIERGYFVRAKTEFTTNKEVQVPVRINTKEQKEIMKRYKGKGKYVFNFLPDDATPLMIFKVQSNGISNFDKQIKKLAKELGINEELSYQWARHSFSTNLHKEGVSERAIQEAMGHTDIGTTRKYIDSLIDEESNEIDKALDLSDD